MSKYVILINYHDFFLKSKRSISFQIFIRRLSFLVCSCQRTVRVEIVVVFFLKHFYVHVVLNAADEDHGIYIQKHRNDDQMYLWDEEF